MISQLIKIGTFCGHKLWRLALAKNAAATAAEEVKKKKNYTGNKFSQACSACPIGLSLTSGLVQPTLPAPFHSSNCYEVSFTTLKAFLRNVESTAAAKFSTH